MIDFDMFIMCLIICFIIGFLFCLVVGSLSTSKYLKDLEVLSKSRSEEIEKLKIEKQSLIEILIKKATE